MILRSRAVAIQPVTISHEVGSTVRPRAMEWRNVYTSSPCTFARMDEQRAERLCLLVKRLRHPGGLDRDALKYVEQAGDERRVLRDFDVRRDIDGIPEEVRKGRERS